MKIGYVCQYFPPECCAPAARAHDLAREWVKLGHPTTVITGFPNHPEGKIHADYRSRWRTVVSRETRDNISVWRSWLYPARNHGMWLRTTNYLSFAVSSAVVGTAALGTPDVVIATSPQLLVGAAGLFISRVRSLPFVFEVRDLWPESLVAVGQTTSDSLVYSLLERLSRLLYKRADHIVVDGEHKRSVLMDLGVSQDKIDTVRNGVADEFCLDPASAETRRIRDDVRMQYGWTGRFIAMYSGTIGMAHGLETILMVADRLRNYPELVFVILGEGADKEKLIQRVNQLSLPNVAYLGKQPRDRIPAYLAAADVCIIPLRRSPVFRTAIPSKLFEAMGAGKPIVLAVEGEAEEILAESKAGIAVPPESPREMAEALMTLWHHPKLCREFGLNGRRAAINNFTRSKQAASYVAILEKVMQRRARPLQSKDRPVLPASSVPMEQRVRW